MYSVCLANRLVIREPKSGETFKGCSLQNAVLGRILVQRRLVFQRQPLQAWWLTSSAIGRNWHWSRTVHGDGLLAKLRLTVHRTNPFMNRLSWSWHFPHPCKFLDQKTCGFLILLVVSSHTPFKVPFITPLFQEGSYVPSDCDIYYPIALRPAILSSWHSPLLFPTGCLFADVVIWNDCTG